MFLTKSWSLSAGNRRFWQIKTGSWQFQQTWCRWKINGRQGFASRYLSTNPVIVAYHHRELEVRERKKLESSSLQGRHAPASGKDQDVWSTRKKLKKARVSQGCTGAHSNTKVWGNRTNTPKMPRSEGSTPMDRANPPKKCRKSTGPGPYRRL